MRPVHSHVYADEAGRKYHEAKHGTDDATWAIIAEFRRRKLQKYIKPLDVVLEFGVGTGWNLAHLVCGRKLGFDVVHVLSPAAGGVEFVSNLDDVKDGSIDVVICHHVLEHVPNPIDVLRKLHATLRPTGTLILNVPLETRRRDLWPRQNESDHHTYCWTPRTLANLLREAQFRVSSLATPFFGYERFSGALARKIGGGFPLAALFKWALNIISPSREVMTIAHPK